MSSVRRLMSSSVEAVVVGGRHDRRGLLDVDHDDRVDSSVLEATLALVEAHDVVVDGPVPIDPGRSFEPVPLPTDGIDDVDLHDSVAGVDVAHGLGRVQIEEHEVIVVPDRGRALGRQVGRAVGADRGHVTQALLSNDPLHVLVEHLHSSQPVVTGTSTVAWT